MTFERAFKNLDDDIHNYELPRDLDRALKITEDLPPMTPGTRIRWYYQEDLDYLLEQQEDDGATEDFIDSIIEWSYGTLIPVPDMENRGFMDAREDDFNQWVVVIDQYPTEKCYPLTEWVAFNRFLDADNLVKVRVV